MIPQLALTYYGDDFTGSTDVMEVLNWAGLPAVLFIGELEEARLRRFPNARAVGIAGSSRSQSPAWMDAHLPAVFERLKALGAPLCHYKVCSTFDSSATVGSIGRALELGQDVFAADWVPVVVAAPELDRYQAFGNLFAGVRGNVYRLDRHPTMSRHPVTPMDEADLRVHLAKQTNRTIGLVDLLDLASDGGERLRQLETQGARAIIFDAVDDWQLAEVGRLIWERKPAFAVGSSGLEYALTGYWRSSGELPAPLGAPRAAEADRIVVVSGSCSPETEASIRWALERGYVGIRLDARALVEGSTEAAAQAVRALAESRGVVLYSALGRDDAELVEGGGGFQQRLGQATGRVLRRVLEESGVRRTIVCGGDTSSHAGVELGVYALTAVAPMAPGAPLCRAYADGAMDGLEIVFKGGQRGGPGFFEKVRMGC